MLIYRIEHEETEDGPYIGERSSDVSFHHWCSDTHPSPREEGLHRNEEHFCGFQSKKQLKSWFNEDECTELSAAGFIVAIYNVHKGHVQVGDKQTVFVKEFAKRTSIQFMPQ